MPNDGDETAEHDPLVPARKALARSVASFGTWFITEYPKLLVQQSYQHPPKRDWLQPLQMSWQRYKHTLPKHHVRGATSSAAQRGSSAFIMFYGQAHILAVLEQCKHHSLVQFSPVMLSGTAGFLGGAASSLVHTLFEPLKIRHTARLTWPIYRASLYPMIWRHALFDGTFFATSSALHEHWTTINNNLALEFAIAGVAASTVNLTHDVWKTRYIQALPKTALTWTSVVRGMTMVTFGHQLLFKAVDLGGNWWATGWLYSHLLQYLG